MPKRVAGELDASFEVLVHDSERSPSRVELLRGVEGAAGVVTMLNDRVDEELLEAAGLGLRVVSNYAVGVDNVDLRAASGRGVLVTNTPDVLTEATAELTIALILAVLRRVADGDRLLRRRTEWTWAPTFMLGRGLGGRTLGCVGFGRIGRAVAEKARVLGMDVVYSNRSGPVTGEESSWLPLDRLLATADVVSIHCPLTAETHHLIDARALQAMRPDAVLVNTARGPIVDEQALTQALAGGFIAGAALDVYEREPVVAPELLELDNVVLAPHLGSATDEAREAMGMLCVEALRAVLVEDCCPANAVNPEVWRATRQN